MYNFHNTKKGMSGSGGLIPDVLRKPVNVFKPHGRNSAAFHVRDLDMNMCVLIISSAF